MVGTNKKLQGVTEATYGTKPGANTDQLSYLGESFKFEVDRKAEESLMLNKTVDAYTTFGVKTSGEINGIVKPDNVGFFLKQAMKEPANPTLKPTTTGVYKHSFVPLAAGDAQASATYTIDRGATIKAYTGCLVDTLKIDGTVQDHCKYSVTLKGKDEVSGTLTGALTNPTLSAMTFMGGAVSVGGASLTNITDFSFGVSNALDDGSQTNGSGLYRNQPLHGEKKITIDLTAEYDASTEAIRETNFKGGAYAEVILTFKSASVIEGTEAYTVTLTMPKVAINTAEANVSGKDRIKIKLGGVATENGAVEPLTIDFYSNKNTKY